VIQELLYTSHEGRGLRQGGGGGFCTVLSTEGMATNLAAALEKLSGYKRPFDIHDPRSARNLVNYRHAIIRIGGAAYHVLSRIADLKGEHTGRSNKLAHHVVLTQSDLVVGGPTRLLTHPGFSRTAWDGKVELVHAVSRSAKSASRPAATPASSAATSRDSSTKWTTPAVRSPRTERRRPSGRRPPAREIRGIDPRRRRRISGRRQNAALSGGCVPSHLYGSGSHVAKAELGVAVMHQRRFFVRR
jgi:hypothetical protein